MPTPTDHHQATVTLPADDQILITREFDAPRHLLYRAWTTPDLVKRWFGGNHGEVTLAEIDLRVGGRWRYVIAGEHGFNGVYRELAENERIVTTEIYEPHPEGEAVNTLTLAEHDGRTTMTVLIQHQSQANRDAVLAAGMERGMNASMDALEKVAAALA
jgi:uncharacterized protein YndB with AHSA1/START domain